MYQKVYAIMYNNSLSSVAFNELGKAFDYCQERATYDGSGWSFTDEKGNIYRIFELKVK